MNRKIVINQYRYAVLDDDEEFDTYPFNSDANESDTGYLARKAAEDYYFNHNSGWDYTSLRSIEIFKEGGTSLGVFFVGYVFVPNFWIVPEKQSNPSCKS